MVARTPRTSAATPPGAAAGRAALAPHWAAFAHVQQLQQRRLYSTGASGASGAAAAAAEGASQAALRGLAAVRARPFAHAAAFGATHVGVAWALVPPLYLLLHQFNLTTTLLAGPQAAYVLSRPVPDWLPVPGWKRGGGREQLEADDAAGERAGKPRKQRTVEDCLGAAIRASVVAGWSGGKALYGGARSLSQRLTGSDDPVEGARRAKGALAAIAQSEDPEQAARTATQALEDATRDGQQHQDSHKARASGLLSRAWKGSVAKHAEDVEFSQVRDAVAAWVLVKALLPVRVPLSLWLTPKTVRFFTRAFRR